MAKYKFEECNDIKKWDAFVDESPQGTIFSNTKLISCVSGYCDYYFVMKGEEVVGAVSVITNKDKRPVREIPYMQYLNSILFKNNDSLIAHKKITEEFKITELIINELFKIYKEISIINTTRFNDLRPFQWYNYHQPELGTFINTVKYTGIVSLLPGTNDLIKNYRTDRRSDLKSSEGNYKIIESDESTLLNQLHEKTFKRHNRTRSDLEVKLMEKIVNTALEKGFGRLSVCYFNDSLASASFLLFDKKRCYHMFGANDPLYRKSKSYSKLVSENILFAKKSGFTEFDFIGINSPDRGDYKISFNSDIKMYYSSLFVKKNIK